MGVKLIADSGATKAEWCVVDKNKVKTIFTQGISPYFLTREQIRSLLERELLPKIKKNNINEVYYYGTGLGNPVNIKMMRSLLKQIFPKAKRVEADHDLKAAARALCGRKKGIACILGTGSNSCFYNGKKIIKNSPGLGFILGDEGSGAYLGKKVVQYYLYGTFDEDLRDRFEARYQVSQMDILNAVYKKPMPNRYLAGYALFLAENRGHYMVENIIEDGLNDFFFNHLYKYRESWTNPINFVGGVAWGFRDVLKELCNTYELELGTILKNPMVGLIKYHSLKKQATLNK
ncbi:MAG TPA: N-acetylglucosamine kinase [Chitinophagaceae bacterium]|nr:N-acetylglucosamine kinase [Chitinophagaceae bacterium]